MYRLCNSWNWLHSSAVSFLKECVGSVLNHRWAEEPKIARLYHKGSIARPFLNDTLPLNVYMWSSFEANLLTIDAQYRAPNGCWCIEMRLLINVTSNHAVLFHWQCSSYPAALRTSGTVVFICSRQIPQDRDKLITLRYHLETKYCWMHLFIYFYNKLGLDYYKHI